MSGKKLIFNILTLMCLTHQVLMSAPVKEAVQIRFRINQSALDPAFKQNASALGLADSLLSLEGVQRVTIRSTCSPDGPLAFNRYLAKARAESIETLIKIKHPDLPEDTFNIEVVEEDWDSLAENIRKSGQPWAQEALGIINNGGSQMKSLLQELWVGEAWDYMVRHYFQQLRSVKMEVVISRPQDLSALRASAKDLQITYPAGIRYVYPRYKDNRAQLQTLQNWIDSGVDTLYIKTFTSPDGSSAANTQLAANRAAALEQYLRTELSFQGIIVSRCEGESWEGVANCIENAAKEADWSHILDIVRDNTTSSIQKKRLLQQPANVKAWQQIRSSEAYENLRAAYISL